MGVESLPDFALREASDLGRRFSSRGAPTYRAAARLVRDLPYGRNSDRSGYGLVLEEGRGTCSTKHALLAALAAQNAPPGLPPVELRLGVYEMTGANTPGVGAVLRRHGLPCVPEAHCYLAYRGVRVDLTRRDGEGVGFSFLVEGRIAPEGIGRYKVEFHKGFVRDWALAQGLEPEGVWAAREECILALAEEG